MGSLSNKSSVSSVSSSVSAVTVIEMQRGDSDQETAVKTKPPTGISKSRGTSRQNSGQETPTGSRLVLAEAAQHRDALRKKSESSGDEAENPRWSVNIPIIRNEQQTESKIPDITESVEEVNPEKEKTIKSKTEAGQLKIIVHQGKELEKKDLVQKADPYL